MLLELSLETFEQGEGISRTTGEAGNHLIVVDPAHFLRVALDDGIAKGNLTVSRHDHIAAPAHGQDGGA